MAQPAHQWVTTRLWTRQRHEKALVLLRRDGGSRISMEGEGAAAVEAALEGLSRPAPRAELMRLLRPLGSERRAAIDALASAGVIRRFIRGAPRRLRAEGRVAGALRDVLGDGGFPSPPRLVRLLEVGGWVVATEACLECSRLRCLAAQPEGSPTLSKAALRVLVEVAALEMGRRAPGLHHLAIIAPGGRSDGRVLAHPDCPRCAPPKSRATLSRELTRALAGRATAGQRVIREALHAPPLGPLRLHQDTSRLAEYPLEAPFVWGDLRLVRQLGAQRSRLSCDGVVYGKGPDLATCRTMALSEGLERLACISQRPAVWGTARALQNAVPPSRFFSFATARDDLRRRAFAAAWELTEGRPAWVPFETVAVRYPREHYPQGLVEETFFSGAASHRTLAQAIVHATAELLERDAFLIAWYRRRSLPRVRWPATETGKALRLGAYFERLGFELELFDLSLEAGPLRHLLLRLTARRSRGNWPQGGSLLCASSGFTASSALERGLALAAGQVLNFAIAAHPSKDVLNAATVAATAQVRPGWELLTRYLNPAHREAHAFLGQGELSIESLDDGSGGPGLAPLERLRTWFRAAGLQWYAVRLTDPTARAAGFEVAKVCVPGLLRLAPTREGVDLGLARLHQPWPLSTCRLNSDPHPLY